MTKAWCIITPFVKGGYLGESKAGKIYGENRMEVILKLIELTWEH